MKKILNDNEINLIPVGKTVLVGGCFDILHSSHLEFLKLSKNQGDILIILLESDENIKKLKGESRPLNNQNVRAENLSKIKYVDFVINLKTPKSSEYYYQLVKIIEPDIIAVTANDTHLEDKKKQADEVGGKVIEVMERNPDHSTSNIINQTNKL